MRTIGRKPPKEDHIQRVDFIGKGLDRETIKGLVAIMVEDGCLDGEAVKHISQSADGFHAIAYDRHESRYDYSEAPLAGSNGSTVFIVGSLKDEPEINTKKGRQKTMSLQRQLSEANARIEGLEKDKSALEAENSALKEELENAKSALEESSKAAEAAAAEKAETEEAHTAQINDAAEKVSGLVEANAELKEKLDQAEAALAAPQYAGIAGADEALEPGTESAEEAEVPPEEPSAFEQYEAISDHKQKSRFWRENEAAIKESMKASKED